MMISETSNLLDDSLSREQQNRVSFGGLHRTEDDSHFVRSSFGRSLGRFFSEKWTESQRRRTAHCHPGVYPAAFLIRDAILGTAADMAEAVFEGRDYYDPYSSSNNPLLNSFSRACRWVLTMRSVYYLEKTAVWMLVLLSAIEPPFWCRDYDPVDVTPVQGYGECFTLLSMSGPPAFGDGDNVDYYPSFTKPFLSVEQSLIVEWVCISVIVVLMVARFGVDGLSLRRHFFLHREETGAVDIVGYKEMNVGAKLLRFVRLVAVTLLIGGMISHQTLGTSRKSALFLRILITFSLSKSMQREFGTVLRLIPEVSSIMLILFVVILFYGWIGCVMFYETSEGEASFSNLVESMWTLWIMVTTANYPDVMMPAYNVNPLAALYFVSFMMISFFFIMGVVLASVVNSYQNDDDMRKAVIKELRQRNLQQAFELLDDKGEGWVDRETIMGVFLVLNQDIPQIRYIPAEEAELLFAVLDSGGENQISEGEFMSFCKVMLLQFERASAYTTFIERHFPSIFHSDPFQAFTKGIKSEIFEHLVDGVVVLNAVFVFIQSYPQLVGEPSYEDEHVKDGYIDTPWERFQTVFTVIYCIEMGVKILVLGWKRYSESFRNLFDAFITVLSFASTCYVYYPNRYSDSRLIRFVVMARVLRLVRVLVAMKQFQVIGSTFIDILPAARRILLFLFSIMYIFSSLGMILFGGLITRDPINPLSEKLRGTSFAENNYWENNFNDLLAGMNVLFNLLVVNNWTTQADGILAVTGTKFSRLYFLGFHLVGVVLVANVVTAFIIDSFIDEWKEAQQGGSKTHDTGDAIIDERTALFDAQLVTGTRTKLDGKYYARLQAANPDQLLSMRMGDELKKLFTKTSSGLQEVS